MKTEYSRPAIDSMEVISDDFLCTSPGIDPEGNGHDFNWGNDTGIAPGGSGDDFNWGN